VDCSQLRLLDCYAVLYVLRGLARKDGGDSSARWRELIGLATEKPRGEPKAPALEKIAVPTINTDRPR
jgi:hypothetical protein